MSILTKQTSSPSISFMLLPTPLFCPPVLQTGYSPPTLYQGILMSLVVWICAPVSGRPDLRHLRASRCQKRTRGTQLREHTRLPRQLEEQFCYFKELQGFAYTRRASLLPWLPLLRAVISHSCEAGGGNESIPFSCGVNCNPTISELEQSPEEICPSKVRSVLSRITHAVEQGPLHYKGFKSMYYLHVPTKWASHFRLLSEDQKHTTSTTATAGTCATEFSTKVWTLKKPHK